MHASSYGWVAPLKFRALPGEVDNILAFAVNHARDMEGAKVEYDFSSDGSTLTFNSHRDIKKVARIILDYIRDPDTLSAEGETAVRNAKIIVQRLVEGLNLHSSAN